MSRSHSTPEAPHEKHMTSKPDPPNDGDREHDVIVALENDKRALEMQLAEATAETERIRQRWKEAVGQLNRLRAQEFFQVTDEFLTAKTRELRYSIRTWAKSYFDHDSRVPGKSGAEIRSSIPHYEKYFDQVMPKYQTLFSLPGGMRSFMEAFLWRVICGEVFGRYKWAGKLTGSLQLLRETIISGLFSRTS
jgi:hypothetical protein